MKRVAIVGGGISGLAAANALEKRRSEGASLEYVLYESSPRLGGVLRTERIDGCIVEAGPDSFLTEKTWAADLARSVGLGDQLIGSNDGLRKTYILTRGRLVPMPDGLMFMVPTKILPTISSPLFSWKTKTRMAGELFRAPRQDSDDESVASFVERHYGAEVNRRLADPLLSGIYGGEAAELSVRAVLPRFVEMEQKHGSLGRAMLAARKKRSQLAKNPPPLFTSLKHGMESLAQAVIAGLSPAWLRVNTRVDAIQPGSGGWVVSAGAQSEHFNAIILAVPAPCASHLLSACAAELSADLRGIAYTSSITVALGFGREVRESLPPGFGFLVPRGQGFRMMAATFVHNKFPYRAPDDRALLRCFFAGKSAESVWHLANDELVGVARNELQKILGLRSRPLFARVFRWKAAMAQYGVGHLERIERIDRLRQKLPELALAGNAYRGIGIPDCIRSGQEAVVAISRSKA